MATNTNYWPAGGPPLGTLDETTSWIIQNLPTTQGAGLSLAAIQALCTKATAGTVQQALTALQGVNFVQLAGGVYWRGLL